MCIISALQVGFGTDTMEVTNTFSHLLGLDGPLAGLKLIQSCGKTPGTYKYFSGNRMRMRHLAFLLDYTYLGALVSTYEI